MRKELYTFRSTSHQHQVSCLKMDLDWNPTGRYTITVDSAGRMHCDCFAAHRHTCRHREMLVLFVQQNLIDTGAHYEYDRQRWHQVGVSSEDKALDTESAEVARAALANPDDQH